MEAEYKKGWIPVEISQGMFPSELAVLITLKDGSNVSLFADKDIIKEEFGKQLLWVTIVEEDSVNKLKRVLLPTETIETATRWVEVSSG